MAVVGDGRGRRPVCVGAAWVASNGPWADVSPEPLAAELRLEPEQAPRDRNGFVALQGLSAPVGVDVFVAGQAALRRGAAQGSGLLRWPQDPLWTCRPGRDRCVALWLAQPERAHQLLAAAQVLGARCELVEQAAFYEELLPEREPGGSGAARPFASLPLPRFSDLGSCVQWFGMTAALASDPAQAEAALRHADHLARRALAGSRSLLGTMMGVAAVQRSWLQAAELVARGSVRRELLQSLLVPLPARALSPRHWVPSEARFTREVLRDLAAARDGCADAASAPESGVLDRLACRYRYQLGLLPELSARDSDAQWQARLASASADGPVACEQLSAAPWRVEPRRWPAWRNTLGRWTLDAAPVDWAVYAARQLDLELLRQSLLAPLIGQATPSAARLRREGDVQRFAGCRARLVPDDPDATLSWAAL